MILARPALTAILVASLLLQAVVPRMRVVIVSVGAALACLVSAVLGVVSTPRLLAEVPWEVLVILVALGLLSQVFASSHLFDRLAVSATRLSRADPRLVALVFAVAMYVVSGVVNNLTALVLVLPVLHALLKLSGVRQRYASWTLGVLLVACNLGGAATPIGDFPAILLLSGGRMTFTAYLARAAPATLVALVLLLVVVHLVVRPARDVPRDPVSARITTAVMVALNRRVAVDQRIFLPAAVALGLMVLAWTLLPEKIGVTPELVCWLGAGAALLASGRLGEKVARTGVDGEAVLFLLSLFVMVGAVRRTGMFDDIARSIGQLPVSPPAQLMIFLVLSGVITGLFSAGPSMAALLEVADKLAERLPPSAVYVGLALSVCAGSSLFLTAATSGPLAQALTERANLRDPDDVRVGFGFLQFLPIGLLSFALIQAVALGYAAFELLR